MEEQQEQLSGASLLTVTLPGTHDSAAFALTSEVMPGTLPWPLDDIVQLAASAGVEPAEYLIHWSLTQVHDIRGQLDRGVRSLDLRAGVLCSSPPLLPDNVLFTSHHCRECHCKEHVCGTERRK